MVGVRFPAGGGLLPLGAACKPHFRPHCTPNQPYACWRSWLTLLSLCTTPSTLGTNPSTLGTNPSTLGTTPRTLGTIPRTLGTTPHTLGIIPRTLGTIPHTLGIIPRTLGLLLACLLLDAQARPQWSNNWTNWPKYYVLQLGDPVPNQDWVLGPS